MNASFSEGDSEDVSSSSRKCDCGLDAKLRTSTTVRNPGRRMEMLRGVVISSGLTVIVSRLQGRKSNGVTLFKTW
ncbi:hypothetical protein LWI28_006347 [Acer negundo]|uniref:Uncharacterized protein n=1 Tax=Acer negundo TaxID=4023 RepID=A0AAD5J831_ACENE|nr:hypothetical protein LWI28_006347 [Acer negundo]KAK4852258.1 hypothetical protein QYF36_022451 [Acer negundo]